jgi:CheY-like chemotaxis protein
MTDLNQYTAENQRRKKKNSKRILIADLNSFSFYKTVWFSISDVKVVQNGNKRLEIIPSSTENDNNNNSSNNDYDIIILDFHPHDISGLEVARKIRDRLSHKSIILTTTYSLDNINNMIDSMV